MDMQEYCKGPFANILQEDRGRNKGKRLHVSFEKGYNILNIEIKIHNLTFIHSYCVWKEAETSIFN